MNKLSTAKRAQVFACIAEGNSLRATAGLTGVCFNAVLQMLPKLGLACSQYQDTALRNLPCKRVQADEIWAFVGCKEKNVTPEKKAKGQGDTWTWLATCADTKLLACWYIGTRDSMAANHFMHDVAGRVANRVQLTTDGHKAYLSAVEDVPF